MLNFGTETVDAMTARDWLIDGRVQRVAISTAIAKWLEDDGHVATATAPPEEVAATVLEIGVGILGVSDPALYELVQGLTGPSGPVQYQGLTDGLVLAGTRVTRMVTVEGGAAPQPKRFSARFLSSDPEVLRGTIVQQQADRQLASATRLHRLMGTIGERVPALAGERSRILGEIAAKATELAQ